MNKILVSILLLLLLVAPARGDFRTGYSAYQSGDFETALRELLPMVQKYDIAELETIIAHSYANLGKPDYVESAKWFLRAAEKGQPNAQTRIGVLYENGLGVEQDYKKALFWYQKAAAQLKGEPQFFLCTLYISGRGVEKDDATAFRLCMESARAGDRRAQSVVSDFYGSGRYVKQDYQKSFEWAQKAAQQGLPQAQVKLGSQYFMGEGVPQDYVLAYMWFNLAAAQGDAEAARFRKVVAEEMSPTQIATAQRLAREWRLSKGDPSRENPAPSKRDSRTSGTGFVVSRQGYVLTNNHVVQGCASLKVSGEGVLSETPQVVATDSENDLALLKLSTSPKATMTFRAEQEVKPGDSIVTVGYPLIGLLASQQAITTGVVSRLAGIANDIRFLEITAPVQPGSSGGPVLDQSGNVIGLVVGKLDAIKIAKATGDIPQNVNFAIKSSVLRTFLQSHSIVCQNASSKKKMETAEIGERARLFVVLVECQR